jgi:uncharacterized protein YndB with AHSA1/START domain
MAHAEQTVTVPQPITAVFDFLADGVNDPKWRPDVTSMRHVSGEGVGSLYAQTMRGPGGRSIPGDYRVTTFQRPTRLEFEVVAGPARPTGSFALKEVDATTTELTFTMDLKPRGLMIVMTPMINKQVKAEVANIANVPAAMAS